MQISRPANLKRMISDKASENDVSNERGRGEDTYEGL
jgi:hypothetical protein